MFSLGAVVGVFVTVIAPREQLLVILACQYKLYQKMKEKLLHRISDVV